MTDDETLQQRIRQRAYQLWEEAGRPEGQHGAHWELATQQVLLDQSRTDVSVASAKAPITELAKKESKPFNSKKKT